MEWLWEHLLPLAVGLVGTGLPFRLAQAICLVSSWHRSLIHSSCHWWGRTLGTTTHPPVDLLSDLQYFPVHGPKRVQIEGCSGAIASVVSTCSACEHFGTLFSSLRQHYGAYALTERDPTLACRCNSSADVLIKAH